MARRRKGNNIHGMLLLDKASGISSNKALQQVKRLFQAKKAGHTGTLDPLATGLLPICFGDATRISSFLLNHHKEYEVCVQLGVATDTADSDGVPIHQEVVPSFTDADLLSVLQSFLGAQKQIPPMYSALKYQGKRLYEIAREGRMVDRPARDITIFELERLQNDPLLSQLTLRVKCSKGTYVRVLVEDIAKKLGSCGHIISLRRTSIGDFNINHAVTFSELDALNSKDLNNYLQPADTALAHWPSLTLPAADAVRASQGQSINISDLKKQQHSFANDDWIRIYCHENHFIGIGQFYDGNKLVPKRIFSREA